MSWERRRRSYRWSQGVFSKRKQIEIATVFVIVPGGLLLYPFLARAVTCSCRTTCSTPQTASQFGIAFADDRFASRMEATGRSASHSFDGNRWISAEQQIDMEGTKMRRRSRRSKPINMLGAFLIEAGTMLAIVALAQPTWTRSLIEQIGAGSPASVSSAAVSSVVTADEDAPDFRSMQAVSHVQAVASQGSSSWEPSATSATRTTEPSQVMQPAADTTERLAMAGWPVQSRPADDYAAAPQYSQYSVDPYATGQHYSHSPRLNPRSAIRPIYPPPASSQSMPAWSNSY